MAEGRLGELQGPRAGLVEELGRASQQPLGLGKRLRQLLLPLHKLGVTLQGNAREGVIAAPTVPTDMGIAGNARVLASPLHPSERTLNSSAPRGEGGPCQPCRDPRIQHPLRTLTKQLKFKQQRNTLDKFNAPSHVMMN